MQGRKVRRSARQEREKELRDFYDACETVAESKPGWRVVRVWEPLPTDIPLIDKSERFDH